MGTVLDLERWRPISGDWTSLERSQLYALAERLPPDLGREIVMGVTDAGDPWFVVLSGEDEVELHVARIGGRFVMHAGDDAQVAEAPDIWTAAQRLGGFGVPERRATVTALFGDTLPLEAIAALESEHAATTPEPARIEPVRSPASAPPLLGQVASDQAPAVRSEPVRLELAPLEPAEEPRPAAVLTQPPSPDLAAEPSPVSVERVYAFGSPLADFTTELEVIGGSASIAAGGETLNGTTGTDTLAGGPGDDVIDGGGAGPGEVDLLDGGGGDDRLVLGPNVVAIGGRGSDGFLVVSPNTGLVANNFGIVMDFFQSRADRLEFAPGARVQVVAATPEPDILAPVRGQAQFHDAPVVPGVRLALDMDGDGQADGYVLLGAANLSDVRSGPLPLAPGPGGFAPAGYDPPLTTPPNLVGLEARPAGGQNMVLTAYQVGPNYFPDAPTPGALPTPGLLRPEDLATTHVELFA